MHHKLSGNMGAIMIVLASTGLVGCSSDSDHQTEEVAVLVERREIAFARTMETRDIEAFKRFVSPEAIFLTGKDPLVGREAIIQAWATFFEEETAPFSWHPDEIVVLESGHLAFSSGPVFGTAGENLGRFNSVWRLDEDGEWRVVFDKGS
jgi:ketosteroid isomerase-like protein